MNDFYLSNGFFLVTVLRTWGLGTLNPEQQCE